MFLQDGDGYGLRPRQMLLESAKGTKYNLMTAGEFGDDSITSIPFQVCDFVSSNALVGVVMNVDGLVEIRLD